MIEKFSLSTVCLLTIAIFFLTIVQACEKRAETVTEMEVFFEWNPPGTSVYENPEIRLSSIPKNTYQFSVKLEDLDMKSYNHGGGKYVYRDSPVIPSGKLEGDFQGPQPPPNRSHRYEITVKALDPSGVVIGEGSYTRKYPEKD